MGGSGSNRWGGHWKKDVVEDCLHLDVRGLARYGVFDYSNWRGTWRWGDNWISLSYDGSAEQIHLDYQVKIVRTGETHKVNHPVQLTHTYPTFGGKVPWFLCPHCGRRVGKLYEPPGQILFRCRHCWDLTYRSCQERRKGEIYDLMRLLDKYYK